MVDSRPETVYINNRKTKGNPIMTNTELKISDFDINDIIEYVVSLGNVVTNGEVEISDFDINDIIEYVEGLGCKVIAQPD